MARRFHYLSSRRFCNIWSEKRFFMTHPKLRVCQSTIGSGGKWTALGQWRGQTHHFFTYASKMEPPQVWPYAPNRWHSDFKWLYGALVSKLTQNKMSQAPMPPSRIWPFGLGQRFMNSKSICLSQTPHMFALA